jgi:flavin reductase (DIM6/NTAB) family NADH-FMN oxidoreductase RutF
MCSSKPPSVAVSFKKVRAAYDNIMERKAFTAGIPSQDYVNDAAGWV